MTAAATDENGGAWQPSARLTAVCATMILVLAVGLRAWAFDLYAIHHPDELFQYLEPAHRLVFGYGVKPWEYRYGMRSWLVPLALSGPMRLGAWAAPGTSAYLWAPKLAAALVALTPVGAAYAIGARSSRLHGLVAMFVAAAWFEQVYFSVHILSEVFAVAAFLTAAALAGPQASRGRMAGAGALLGLAFVLRFHYAPALAVFAVLTCRAEVKTRWLPLVGGGLAALALSAGIDAAMGQVPFGWVVENFRQNVVRDRASGFGTAPPFTYFAWLWVQWRFAMPVLLLLTLPGRRREGALFWSVWVNLLIHMAIGHKEYRFVWLSASTIGVLAAIGSVDVARALADRPGWSGRMRPAAVLCALFAAWGATSAALAATAPMRNAWRSFDPELRLTAEAPRAKPGLCGIALHRLSPWHAGGASYLHRPVPWYLTGWLDQERIAPAGLPAASRAFDVVIARRRDARDLPADFAPVRCLPPPGGTDQLDAPVCLYVRPGGCAPHAADRWRVEAVLLRHDA